LLERKIKRGGVRYAVAARRFRLDKKVALGFGQALNKRSAWSNGKRWSSGRGVRASQFTPKVPKFTHTTPRRPRKRKARREQIEACARRLGFRFDAEGTSFNLDEWAELSLFEPYPRDIKVFRKSNFRAPDMSV
jgi:hypothetical protein